MAYRFYITEGPGHAKKLAGSISEENDNDIRLIVVGGDGTINEVLSGIKD
ncbi:MAG: diacylglycerol kinase family lipid kinase, partial [Lachnospiraceae bacterium]|nr:diacylglycerol kinase family lipid kinase [Lachnospiraceae bacterium]